MRFHALTPFVFFLDFCRPGDVGGLRSGEIGTFGSFGSISAFSTFGPIGFGSISTLSALTLSTFPPLNSLRSLRSLAPVLSLALIPVGGARADAVQDFRDLETVCRGAVEVVERGLNSTGVNATALSTPDLLGNFTGSIIASKIHLQENMTTYINNQPLPLDEQYLNYTSCIPTLSSRLISRGTRYHDEANSPVFNALQDLARAIPSLGTALRDANITSREAMVRTLRAGSTVVDAQSAWDRELNYPGSVGGSGGNGNGGRRRVRRSGGVVV
ncbi:hypothetical protein K402DRAFT_373151 [Aulographum hederae CBS 113979]|uniref:Uncharacterized protein n=1 Tax=Aulographum hederae CBS 113979 TaxID=1176131 RepID=A0A6G1H6N1_9PEZI|nr:hypothetical protein K402DRAFT_373151 [Aulographum hederae CBS 113979]